MEGTVKENMRVENGKLGVASLSMESQNVFAVPVVATKAA